MQTNYLIYILTVLNLVLIPNICFSELARLNQISQVHTSHWINWSWESSLPDDVVSFSISGRFEVLIEEGGISPYTGEQYPDTIKFINIDVSPFNYELNKWYFPDFEGVYDEGEFFGSKDPCFNNPYPGSCYSQGDFGWFSGIIDNGKIILKGGKDSITDINTNAYYYVIEADIVKKGDLNGDGFTSLVDVIFGLKILTGEDHELQPSYINKSYVDQIRIQDIIETISLLAN